MYQDIVLGLLPRIVGTTKPKFPFFNLTNVIDGECTLEVALAGYRKEDIKVSVLADKLIISSDGAPIPSQEYIVYGITGKKFNTQFSLPPNTSVRDVSFVDGILRVKLYQPDEKAEYFDIR